MKFFSHQPEFIAATCPKCGGRLELDVNFEVAYCADCGTQCIIRNVKKKIKRTPLDKIIEFGEKHYNVYRQDKQQEAFKQEQKQKEIQELKEKKKIERKIWWDKHWLKVMVISFIVFIISLIYNYLIS